MRSEVKPTFVLMDMQPNKVISYIYTLSGDDVAVDKVEFTKATADE